MTQSAFSPELSVKMGPAPAPLPPVLSNPVIDGKSVKLTIQLPALDYAGNPAAFSILEVFVKETSMVGSTPEAERAIGTSMMILDVIPPEATYVEVEVPDLDYDTEYFFAAAVR